MRRQLPPATVEGHRAGRQSYGTMLSTLYRRAVLRLGQSYCFWRHVCLRFWHDDLFTKAAALAFQTALAIVPLFTIVLSVLSAFPGFRLAVVEFQSSLFDVLMPHAEAEIRQQLESFVDRAQALTTLGVLALAIIAMMLLHTVSSTFDAIYRVKRPRSLATRFMAYWTLLTLGPLLFAVGFSITAAVFADSPQFLGGYLQETFGFVKSLVPFGIEWLAFSLLYWLAPSRPARFVDALSAAIVAAVMFQILKAGFALYLLYVASYESIYGAVAAIPVTLLWLQAAWAVALFGATIAATLPEWRARHPEPRAAPPAS